MLVHICCSVDSHFFLQKLQNDYPKEQLRGFFYNPNIHPYSEYKLRLLDVERSCKKLNIPLIEGNYSYENWLNSVKGVELEPEKGKRCEICFDGRFSQSANKALELGEKSFTTTLLMSPLKSQEQLKKIATMFYEKSGVEFIAVDYRSNGGSNEQSRVTKEQQLYRQDYCGCIYGLNMQRKQQNKLADELFSPISNTNLPSSIEERLELYTKRMDLEDRNIKYKIIKSKFLNYRQFNFLVKENKNTIIDSYALSYSTLPKKNTQGKINFTHKNIHFLNRDEIKFITLKYFNLLANTDYQNIKKLIYNPPTYQEENAVREKITQSNQDLSPIIVVEFISNSKISIQLSSKVYEDIREKLIFL